MLDGPALRPGEEQVSRAAAVWSSLQTSPYNGRFCVLIRTGSLRRGGLPTSPDRVTVVILRCLKLMFF